jgi:hypothetical protein
MKPPFLLIDDIKTTCEKWTFLLCIDIGTYQLEGVTSGRLSANKWHILLRF